MRKGRGIVITLSRRASKLGKIALLITIVALVTSRVLANAGRPSVAVIGVRAAKRTVAYQASKSTSYGSSYRISGRQIGRSLDVTRQLTANGSSVEIWDWNGGPNQQWAVKSCGVGTYEIIGVQSGRALEVKAQDSDDGTAIDIWDINDGHNQLWHIEPIGDGYFRIVGVQSGKVLAVKDKKTGNGSALDIEDWNGSASQQWTFNGQ